MNMAATIGIVAYGFDGSESYGYPGGFNFGGMFWYILCMEYFCTFVYYAYKLLVCNTKQTMKINTLNPLQVLKISA